MKYLFAMVIMLSSRVIFCMHPADKPGASKKDYVTHIYERKAVQVPGSSKGDTKIKYTSKRFEISHGENGKPIVKGPVKTVIYTFQ